MFTRATAVYEMIATLPVNLCTAQMRDSFRKKRFQQQFLPSASTNLASPALTAGPTRIPRLQLRPKSTLAVIGSGEDIEASSLKVFVSAGLVAGRCLQRLSYAPMPSGRQGTQVYVFAV